ncbi:MAG: thiamine pyrophosphate-binding protein [Pseudomonadota bacterium]
MTDQTQTGGQLVVDALRAQGVDRVFCVPGESYLAVLDALIDSDIDVINARQEGGAAMMAEADAKLTGRPGVALVTRGPGATNAASGVHVAQQDSTPLVLLVGQIARGQRGRDAFQEVDYVQTFGQMAKWVAEIDSAERVPEMLARAWHTALNGRPGPVVLALPEDMLREHATAVVPGRIEATAPAPTDASMAALAEHVARAERPVILAGGSRWTATASTRLIALATRLDIPVVCTFRRQSLIDNNDIAYAGDLGLAPNPALLERVRSSDLIVMIGTRLSEIPSQSYTLLGVPQPRQTVVHVHPGAEEIGRVYTPTLAINAAPEPFLAAWRVSDNARGDGSRTRDAHAAYRAWSETPPETPGQVQLGHVITHLRDALPADTVYCNGAGNYAGWLHRFMRYRPGTQLAPTSGSMGYGLPAAIAAKRRFPEREVVCLAGDGCLQMTLQELGAAQQHGVAIRVLVADNGVYGTIRMHQARDYPHRVSATTLVNPDFAALARAYGAHAETVTRDADFAGALARACASDRLALLHLKTDAEAITPTLTLSGLES